MKLVPRTFADMWKTVLTPRPYQDLFTGNVSLVKLLAASFRQAIQKDAYKVRYNLIDYLIGPQKGYDQNGLPIHYDEFQVIRSMTIRPPNSGKYPELQSDRYTYK